MARTVRFRFLPGEEPSNFIDLPWSDPLAEWDHPALVRRTRGQSRHVVRFVSVGSVTYALKETAEGEARKEYRLLRQIKGAGLPVVEATGLVTGRQAPDGRDLDGILVTRFLEYSLPFRYLFSVESGSVLSQKLVDAAVVLLVRLHVEGFYWGDCSLSNLLFRRDAGALMAYLVDAETSAYRNPIPDGMRQSELDIARENFAGGLLDLAAEGTLSTDVDVRKVVDLLIERYWMLWNELTGVTEIDARERHLIDQRIRRINEMGFDVDELVVERVPEGDRLRVIPALIEEGHHARELRRMTGLEVQENQARRLLNDIASFGAYLGRVEGRTPPPGVTAARWMAEVYEPIVAEIPEDLRGKLEPAELFHELLEHRYYLSEAAGYEVDNETGLRSYIDSVLRFRPSEQVLFLED
ncbi:MAG TPA: DUF4032 domain-containing protein [Actinomycetota bacterium]|nr:DUF4032 domain-containing protein [Actinomycetota bacterium]